jgi:hypothetical protein
MADEEDGHPGSGWKILKHSTKIQKGPLGGPLFIYLVTFPLRKEALPSLYITNLAIIDEIGK